LPCLPANRATINERFWPKFVRFYQRERRARCEAALHNVSCREAGTTTQNEKPSFRLIVISIR